MELHTLKPAKGSVKSGKRIARGEGSGHGGTSTRGHKGAKSRSGYSKKKAFEGGQMPLQQRLPKRGFKSPNRVEYVSFNTDQLQAFVDKHGVTDITRDVLREKGIIRKTDVIKLLGTGDISAKVNITVDAVSKVAKEKIEALGGSVNIA